MKHNMCIKAYREYLPKVFANWKASSAELTALPLGTLTPALDKRSADIVLSWNV